jgi:hypothetical protein
VRGPQKQKPSGPAKSENEGIQRNLLRTHAAGWPHPSLGGEVGRRIYYIRDRDEHSQTDILTPDLNLAPAFPVFTSGDGSL